MDTPISFAATAAPAPRPFGIGLWGIAAAVLTIVVLVAFGADRVLSHTALLTPISPTGLLVARALGTFAGLLAAVLAISGRGLAFYRQAILFVVIPLGGFALGDGIAWRIAEHWHFAGSQAGWSLSRYPVVNVKGGGKSHSYSLGIDPFGTGEPAEIAIPHAQYRALQGQFTGQCVTVLERRAPDGAVEVSTVPANRNAAGEAEVGPCGAPVSAWN